MWYGVCKLHTLEYRESVTTPKMSRKVKDPHFGVPRVRWEPYNSTSHLAGPLPLQPLLPFRVPSQAGSARHITQTEARPKLEDAYVFTAIIAEPQSFQVIAATPQKIGMEAYHSRPLK